MVGQVHEVVAESSKAQTRLLRPFQTRRPCRSRKSVVWAPAKTTAQKARTAATDASIGAAVGSAVVGRGLGSSVGARLGGGRAADGANESVGAGVPMMTLSTSDASTLATDDASSTSKLKSVPSASAASSRASA